MQMQDHEFFNHTCGLEYKVVKAGKRMNFKSDLRPQQLPCLLQTILTCMYHKISDMSIGIKPYDAVKLVREKAYLVVAWDHPRKPKPVYTLDPQKLNTLQKEGVKSITEDDAKSMSLYTFYV